MTEIEKQALALIAEIKTERGMPGPDYLSARAALIRSIERHEAYKRDVSDAVEAYLAHMSPWPDNSLRRFIIKPPVDPLVEALQVWGEAEYGSVEANALRAALAASGGKIVWEGE